MARISQRRGVPALIGLGVVVPALILAGIGIYLTLRLSTAVEEESARYHAYMGQQVVEAYEQELLAHLRRAAGPAENAARNGATHVELLFALEEATDEFEGSHFVPLNELDGYSLLIVESQPLIYAPGTGIRSDLYFTGLLFRGPDAQVIGAGGWWMQPEKFLAEHLADVMRERLPANPRMYGGLEATRTVSIELRNKGGGPIGNIREPGGGSTGRLEYFAGPFAGYSVNVTPTSNSPASWARRFVSLQTTFIGIMGLVVVVATWFGLRYTRRQLELAQLKSGFVSNVTHELKTPIALIRLAVETLELRRVSSPEEADKFIASIGRETERLSRLVDNILDFARLEAGQQSFRFDVVDVNELIRETIETFEPRLQAQNFVLETDVPEGLPAVRGDGIALSHCLMNLLDNAMKYSKARRELKVAAGVRGEYVTVSVTDRGIGISAADQKRVFEKFVRLETGLVHDVRGAGLGLSLVDQIIRAHGGRIELVSSLGQGSTFTLVLPVASGAEQGETEPSRKTGS